MIDDRQSESDRAPFSSPSFPTLSLNNAKSNVKAEKNKQGEVFRL